MWRGVTINTYKRSVEASVFRSYLLGAAQQHVPKYLNLDDMP